MTRGELDDFLQSEHTCRLATVGPQGPHLSPLWFVWDGDSLWFTSLVNSQRWRDIERDPRVSVVVDTGAAYTELRGVEMLGTVEVVGEIPRAGEPNEQLENPERLMAEKYHGTSKMPHDKRHAWLRLQPGKIVSWDFRKLQKL